CTHICNPERSRAIPSSDRTMENLKETRNESVLEELVGCFYLAWYTGISSGQPHRAELRLRKRQHTRWRKHCFGLWRRLKWKSKSSYADLDLSDRRDRRGVFSPSHSHHGRGKLTVCLERRQ